MEKRCDQNIFHVTDSENLLSSRKQNDRVIDSAQEILLVSGCRRAGVLVWEISWNNYHHERKSALYILRSLAE